MYYIAWINRCEERPILSELLYYVRSTHSLLSARIQRQYWRKIDDFDYDSNSGDRCKPIVRSADTVEYSDLRINSRWKACVQRYCSLLGAVSTTCTVKLLSWVQDYVVERRSTVRSQVLLGRRTSLMLLVHWLTAAHTGKVAVWFKR